MNHQLELAASDTVDEVQSINHFKAFVEKIHNLYSQTNKISLELLEAVQEVGSQVLKIGFKYAIGGQQLPCRKGCVEDV